MFKSSLIIISIFIILSCKSHTERIVKEAYPDGKPKFVEYLDTKNGNNDSYKLNTYYPDSKVKSEGELKNGKMHGKWIYYYENGKKWSEGNFKDGQEEGLRTTYYENGQKRYEGLFRDGVRTGDWKFWDESGKLVKTIMY